MPRQRTGEGRVAPASTRTDSQRVLIWKWVEKNGPANSRLIALRLGLNPKTTGPELTKGVKQTPAWYREVTPPASMPADLPPRFQGGRWVEVVPGVGPGKVEPSPVEELFAASPGSPSPSGSGDSGSAGAPDDPGQRRDIVRQKIATLKKPRNARWLAQELGWPKETVATELSWLVSRGQVYRGFSHRDKIRAPGDRRKTWHYLISKQAWGLWKHGALTEQIEKLGVAPIEPPKPDPEPEVELTDQIKLIDRLIRARELELRSLKATLRVLVASQTGKVGEDEAPE